jgi:hypothetical protein
MDNSNNYQGDDANHETAPNDKSRTVGFPFQFGNGRGEHRQCPGNAAPQGRR